MLPFEPETFLLILAICVGVIALILSFNHNAGFNVPDGGYLWYGTLRVLEGKVPIRDFRAYDPGRYYWTALWLKLLGNKLTSIRFASYIWLLIPLTLVLYLLYFAVDSWIIVGIGSILLACWAQPIHKIIDFSIPLVTIFLIQLLLTHPSNTLIFILFLWIGFTWFVGLNHFIYNGMAGFATCLFIYVQHSIPFHSLTINVFGGLAIGLFPMLLFLLIPYTGNTYIKKKIVKIINRRSTNLKIPIPWPHKQVRKNLNGMDNLRQRLLSVSTILLPTWYILTLILFLSLPDFTKFHFLAASSIVGIFYLNHFYSRSDLAHLYLTGSPMILGILSIQNGNLVSLICLIFLMIYCFILAIHPLYKAIKEEKYNLDRKYLKAGKGLVYLNSGLHNELTAIIHIIKTNILPNESVFITPLLVGIYPLIERESPVYDTFPVYPANLKQQKKMITEIKTSDTRLILVQNVSLDGRADLQFQNTHPLVWSFICQNFKRLDTSSMLTPHFNFFKLA